ncbi:MAG: IMP dehydrogenase, partial [Methanospirillum sp.]
MYGRKVAEAPLALTFDDVLLQPAASAVDPDQTETRSRFSRRIPLNIPLVSAAMDTVTEAAMAIAIARAGGIGVIHRNMTSEEECAEVVLVKQAEELIERQVQFVGPDTTVSEVESLMSGHGIGGVPVVDHDNVVIGIVSRRDVRAIVNRRGKESIRAIMTPSPITADESFTMEDALETMYTNKVERLPVTDKGGHLIGIITM